MSATDITTSHTIWFKDPACLDQSLVGGKGVNLGRLGNAGFAVPGGFVVSTGAYDAHIAGIRERICLECAVAGLHEPFSWHDGPEGCPQWAADDRYEQSVRTTGLIEVAGRTVEFESVGTATTPGARATGGPCSTGSGSTRRRSTTPSRCTAGSPTPSATGRSTAT